jgi:hypothetical protein
MNCANCFWKNDAFSEPAPMSAIAALQSFQKPNSCVFARLEQKSRSSLIVCKVVGRVKFNLKLHTP